MPGLDRVSQCAPLCAGAGGIYSGAALNPARVLGPSLVFGCYWETVPVYILAQLVGATAAAFLTMPLYGFGVWVAPGSPTDVEVRSFEPPTLYDVMHSVLLR